MVRDTRRGGNSAGTLLQLLEARRIGGEMNLNNTLFAGALITASCVWYSLGHLAGEREGRAERASERWEEMSQKLQTVAEICLSDEQQDMAWGMLRAQGGGQVTVIGGEVVRCPPAALK